MILKITMLPKFGSLEDCAEMVMTSRSQCGGETEKALWDMHEKIPSRCWSTGKYVAERIG